MKVGLKRTPRNYEGIASPSKQLSSLLPDVFGKIDKAYSHSPQNLLDFWAEIIGKELAPLARAESLKSGILTVRVKNSTLMSLLSQQEKGRLLKELQSKFSKEAIRNIVFRIG